MLYLDISETRKSDPRGGYFFGHAFTLSNDHGCLMKTGHAGALLDEARREMEKTGDHLTVYPAAAPGLRLLTGDPRKPCTVCLNDLPAMIERSNENWRTVDARIKPLPFADLSEEAKQAIWHMEVKY